jgi:hypothetical protein
MAVLVPLLAGAALLLLPRALWAQENDLGYPNVYGTFNLIVKTILLSGAYLFIYAAALTLTLKSLNRFFEFDTGLLLWIAVLWLGGMGANAAGYALAGAHHPVLAALVAIPLIFGWTLFVCTREWADLLLPGALRVAIVTALCCAPYFGPTWYIGVK